MRIVVAYKWAPNPQDATVRPDGTLDFSRSRHALSEDDPVAIELGRRLADELGAELVGVTVGGPDADAPMARKAALSRGLDRLVVVAGPEASGLEAAPTAALLASAVRGEGDVDLVLTGEASVDTGAGLVPALLAGRLGWRFLAGASAVRIEGATAVVRRESDAGVQTLAVDLPAVLAVAPGAPAARVPGMRDLLAAGRKPARTVAPASLDAGRVPPVAVVGFARPPERRRRRQILDASDPDAAAADLVARLRAEGVL